MQTGSRLPAPGPFAAGARYNSYGAFLKEKFGCRVGKITIDAGFSCPNRDGALGVGGCTYCNNDSFRPASACAPDPIPVQIEKAVAYLGRRYRARKFIAYFQPFSNTYAPLPKLIPLYEQALACSDIVGIAIGTRPDCVDECKIAWLESLARRIFVTLEYGLESMLDTTLARINRGHDFACWLRAMEMTRGRGINISAHVILGFPWESRPEMLGLAGAVSDVGLNFLKVHHLHIVKDTALARQFGAEPFALMSYTDYVDLVVEFLELLNPAIRIERLFGLAPESQLLGPHWGKTKAEMQYDIERSLARRDTWQGRRYQVRG